MDLLVLQKNKNMELKENIKMVTAREVFDYMESVFDKEEALKIKQEIVITYIIAGPGGGTWQLIMNKGEYKFLQGNEVSPVTATVNYKDAETFYKLTTREMSGIKGYATGVIKYQGPAKTLVSVGRVFTTKKKKKKKIKLWKK